jgi:hypothetical protein
MKFIGQAQQAADRILTAFQNPNSLPKPLANVFIRRQDNVPCRKWSWRNQLLVALQGYSDARGFRQWQGVKRSVKKGEKAFFILTPLTKKITNKETGKERVIVFGFGSAAVFGAEQTEGAPLPDSDPRIDAWIDSLPLIDVARGWGLKVGVFDGEGTGRLGCYRRGLRIDLGVENLATWCHELVHAADDRAGNLKEYGQHWRSEVVAELGGAVLLQILGSEREADLGGCWEYIRCYSEKEKIEPVDACGRVLERVCGAVALILDTAEELRAANERTDQHADVLIRI